MEESVGGNKRTKERGMKRKEEKGQDKRGRKWNRK